jgi:hypothetical protein
MPPGGEAQNLFYYLTPLSQWASPPPKIEIVVTLPKALPATHVVPISPAPRCIGERSLFFSLDEFPKQDLNISYPAPVQWVGGQPRELWASMGPLRTAAQWTAWRLSTREPELNCALVAALKKTAEPDLAAILAKQPCRKTCRLGP